MKSRQQNHTANYLDLLLHERLWSVEVEVVRWLLHFIFSPFALKKLRMICQHSSADCKLGLAGQTRQRSERLQRWGHLGTYYREHRWVRLNIDVLEELWLSSSVSGIYREQRWFRLNIDVLQELRLINISIQELLREVQWMSNLAHTYQHLQWHCLRMSWSSGTYTSLCLTWGGGGVLLSLQLRGMGGSLWYVLSSGHAWALREQRQPCSVILQTIYTRRNVSHDFTKSTASR